jgi:sec-independent protein translocase protein TatB
MFDFDAGKLLIIGVVALVVIPPKDLPSVMRQVGQAIGKLRRMAADFQSQFMDAINEAEIDAIRKDVTKLADSTKLDLNFDPVATVRDEIKGALGEGTLAAGAAGTAESAIADAQLSTVAADEAAAAGIAPFAPPQPSQNGEAAPAAIPHLAAENGVPASSAQPPHMEPVAAAQEADARRS